MKSWPLNYTAAGGFQHEVWMPGEKCVYSETRGRESLSRLYADGVGK